MKHKLIVIAFFTFQSVFFCVAQKNFVGQRVLPFPRAYNFPTGNEPLDELTKVEESTNNIWIVFSDRNETPTYSLPGGKKEVKKLAFMDAFYVLEEKGQFIHILKYAPNAFNKKKKQLIIAKNLEDYGWVSKSKMLLWQSCLTTPQRYAIKGLAINSVNTVSDIKKNATQLSGQKLALYNDPELNKLNENDFRLFDFLYIFKKEGDACLVGKINEVRGINQIQSASRYILGWVKNDIIKEWKQRLCLEPNYEPEAIQERNKANVSNYVFINKAGLDNFKKSCDRGSKESVIWEKKVTERMRAEWKRMPILLDEINKIDQTNIKTGIVTDIFGKNGTAVITSDDYLQIDAEYNVVRKKFRNVNIVFVVDGSERLKDFKNTIASTITSVINQCEESNEQLKMDERKGNNYKIGLVVYRDYAEKQCPKGDISIQQRPLTDSYSDIREFFDNEVIMGNCKDQTDYQAVYQGINTATRMFQGRESESNLIILIGCGSNDPADTKIKESEVVDNLAKYKVGMLSFQVKNPSGPAFNDFPIQMVKLAENVSNKIAGQYGTKFPASALKNKNVKRRMKSLGQNSFKFECPESDPLPGVVVFSDRNVSIDEKVLNGLILNSVEEIVESKELLLANMESYLKGQGSKVSMNEGMLAFLSSMKVDVSLLQKVSFDNLQLYVDGYVSLKCSKLKKDLYTYSVLLSYQELSQIISVIKQISKPGSDKEARANMKAAFKEIVAGYYGPKEARNAMNSLFVSDLLTMISGMPSKNSILTEINLNDVTDEKKFPYNQFIEIKGLLDESAAQLEEYRGKESNQFNSDDNIYYWVPQELFL
ncbi:MAG: type VI secretion system protein TssR domain-containing protein [Bacteroidota bacterium]